MPRERKKKKIIKKFKKIASCFGFDSAFKTIDAQMFFLLVFLKTHKQIFFFFWLTHKKSIFKFGNKNRKKIVFIFFFCFSFKNNRRTNVILISIFENAQKNVINCQKRPKWRFWRSIVFLCIFKNTYQKNICASIVFKAESKPKHEENIFWVFFKNQKCTFWGVQNGTF